MMNKKVIDLEIIDDLEDSGVDAIALVDNPAIEKNYRYFNKEVFVEPSAGESQSDFMSRCVPYLLDEGKPQDQAVAICISTYENMTKEVFVYDTFADYPWDECIADMGKRGYDEESSNKLCGWIRANMEINTSGLSPYTQQTSKKKKDVIEESVYLAAIEDLKVGDAVSWRTADQNPRGRIKEIVMRSKIVPGTDFRIEGTPEDPGYIIEIHEKVEGKWQPSGKYVGRKADSILKNVELWRQMFSDEDKKELIGPVAIPDIEIPRKDDDGNIYFVRFSKDVVKKMAEKFMREKRVADNNIQHKDDVDAGSYVFETWIVENPEDKANVIYGLDVPVGTWMCKMRVLNPDTWKKVKAGQLNGFSLQGNFVSSQEYQEYLKDKKMYEDLVNLVKSL